MTYHSTKWLKWLDNNNLTADPAFLIIALLFSSGFFFAGSLTYTLCDVPTDGCFCHLVLYVPCTDTQTKSICIFRSAIQHMPSYCIIRYIRQSVSVMLLLWLHWLNVESSRRPHMMRVEYAIHHLFDHHYNDGRWHISILQIIIIILIDCVPVHISTLPKWQWCERNSAEGEIKGTSVVLIIQRTSLNR